MSLARCSLRIVVAAVLSVVALASPARSDGADWTILGRPLPVPEFLQPRLDPALPLAPSDVEITGRIAGSAPAVLPDLVTRWIAAYRETHPGAVVEVPPPYEAPQGTLSTQLTRFLQGKLHFAFLSRDMSAADQAAFRASHGYDPLVVSVAGGSFRHFGFVDAVAVIVNRANPVRGLSLAQLDAIFSASQHHGGAALTDWGAVGGRAGHLIRVVGGAAWSGQESARAGAFRRVVLDRAGRNGLWRRDVDLSRAEAAVPADVAADPDAIGFTGFGHLDEGVRALALRTEVGGPFVEATYEMVARADYPFARTVTIAIDKTPGRPLDALTRSFVAFCASSEGQRIVLDQAVYLPLRGFQARETLRQLALP